MNVPRLVVPDQQAVFRLLAGAAFLVLLVLAPAAHAASDANLVLPDFGAASFRGISGTAILAGGVIIALLGLVMGFVMSGALKRLPTHRSMGEISDLIYETCKTYLLTQGKFILALEVLVGLMMLIYFGILRGFTAGKVVVILLFSLLGIAGSYGVAWMGIRINNWANCRAAFASLRGRPFPTYAIPLQAGMSIGVTLISLQLLMMLSILLFVPGDYAGSCFIGFAIGSSLAASALRIAGGIFTKIADIGSDMMKIVFNIKEDDARNPGVIADCAGDNAGDSVGPTADGFETYGVTAVALITFVLLAVRDPAVQVQLLVWIFAIAALMIVGSAVSYGLNGIIAKARYEKAERMNFEAPLTFLVWLTSLLSIGLNFLASWLLLGSVGDGTLWWKLSAIMACGTIAGALVPEVIKVFTSTNSGHVKEVVTSSREGGASLNVLSGFIAGNFSAFWMGLVIMGLMALGYGFSSLGLAEFMEAPAIFAFGLVAFGFLAMGPVTIAVDSYGPVTDNAQSVYELSLIEEIDGVHEEVQRDFAFRPDFDRAKDYLEENDGAGNTFKAGAKPVLIGTAVVGAVTLIFSIVVLLTDGLTTNVERLSLLHPPFLLGLIAGGAVIYWFTGAATQAVSTGAYRAVEFIKGNIQLEGVERASVEDSKRVVEICTRYAQKGTVNIFLTVFLMALAFGCLEPFFFIGYLISIALFGLFQALFMANAGGAWDNAKKVVEVELKAKGTDLHAAVVVGDTVGDPFKDTSSVAMNPVIKFTTLFGLLTVELAVQLPRLTSLVLAVVFFGAALVFVYRSFYGMRIESEQSSATASRQVDGSVKPV